MKAISNQNRAYTHFIRLKHQKRIKSATSSLNPPTRVEIHVLLMHFWFRNVEIQRIRGLQSCTKDYHFSSQTHVFWRKAEVALWAVLWQCYYYNGG